MTRRIESLTGKGVEWKQPWPRFLKDLSKTKENLVKPVTVPRFETGGLPNAPASDSNLVCACAMIFICENDKGYNETV